MYCGALCFTQVCDTQQYLFLSISRRHFAKHLTSFQRKRNKELFVCFFFLFQRCREIGQHDAVFAGTKRIAGRGETVVENAILSPRFQEDQRGDTLPRGRVHIGLVLLQISKSVD